MNRRPTFLRSALIVFGVLTALILSGLLAGNLYLRHMLSRVHYVDPSTTPTLTQEQLDAYLATDVPEPNMDVPTMNPEDITFDAHGTQIGGDESRIINILLIGQDRQEGEPRARSDSIILCTFHPDTATLTMTSFLRDLYVKIPGYQDNRINVAYAAGGMPLLNKTLENNFGIHVDGNIEVDFSQFARIVDLLGGVRIELRQDEASWINKHTGSNLSQGSQLLSGDQALFYARIRSLDADGDFSRTSRQRKLLSSLLEAYQNASLSTLLTLLSDILPMITTDMTQTQIVGLATDLFPLLADLTVVSQQIPADGTYSGKSIRGMSVLVADMDAARRLLEETLH